MPGTSFIEKELNKFLFSPVSANTTNRTLLEMIEMTGKLLESAREDMVTGTYAQGVYKATLAKEKLWRERIFVSPDLFNNNTNSPENIEQRQWLVNPTTKNHFIDIVSSILQTWSAILDETKKGTFDKKVQDAIHQAIRRQCVKVLSYALFQAMTSSSWELSWEKELLESFKDPKAFSKSMNKFFNKLCSPTFQHIFPSEFRLMLQQESFRSCIYDQEYFKKMLFLPLLTDSGYLQSVCSEEHFSEQRKENHHKLNPNTLPSDIATIANLTRTKKNKHDVIPSVVGNTEGMRHLAMSLSNQELNNLLNNEETWTHLSTSNNSMSVETILEYQTLTLFLKIIQAHLHLVESEKNSEDKINDFVLALDKMSLHEIIPEINEKAKHNASSWGTSAVNSYQAKREEFVSTFTNNIFQIERIIPESLVWSTINSSNEELKKKGLTARGRTLSNAINWYIDYLNMRGEKELTSNEALIISRLKEKTAFAGLGGKPQVQVMARAQDTLYPSAPLPPVTPSAPPLPDKLLPRAKLVTGNTVNEIPIEQPVVEAINVARLPSLDMSSESRLAPRERNFFARLFTPLTQGAGTVRHPVEEARNAPTSRKVSSF